MGVLEPLHGLYVGHRITHDSGTGCGTGGGKGCGPNGQRTRAINTGLESSIGGSSFTSAGGANQPPRTSPDLGLPITSGPDGVGSDGPGLETTRSIGSGPKGPRRLCEPRAERGRGRSIRGAGLECFRAIPARGGATLLDREWAVAFVSMGLCVLARRASMVSGSGATTDLSPEARSPRRAATSLRPRDRGNSSAPPSFVGLSRPDRRAFAPMASNPCLRCVFLGDLRQRGRAYLPFHHVEARSRRC
jgi:hypothetical protein